MKDARGYEFDELLAMQQKHLLLWKLRLRESLYLEIEAYILKSNLAATEPEGKHRVYRGQDLIQIILDWPNPGVGYPPNVVKDEEGVL